MNVSCPNCGTTYRVDPAKVPAGGVRARCTRCSEVVQVDARGAADPAATPTDAAADAAGGAAVGAGRATEATGPSGPPASPAPSSSPPAGAAVERPTAESPAQATPPAAPAPPAPPAPQARPQRAAPVFGVTDPDAKARRLARALISDIVVYHPERRDRSAQDGSLRKEFREEIQKSWEEYVAQVGDAMARGTPHFRDALNEILAGGQRVF